MVPNISINGFGSEHPVFMITNGPTSGNNPGTHKVRRCHHREVILEEDRQQKNSRSKLQSVLSFVELAPGHFSQKCTLAPRVLIKAV
jgi:hypothetical protein